VPTQEDQVDSFGSRSTLSVGGRAVDIHRIDAVPGADRLPFSLRVLLENVLRNEDGRHVLGSHVEAIAGWDPTATPDREIAFTPARVLLQDFTGVPAVVDLAAMREAMLALGGDPGRIDPQVPAELVIDHSVIADAFGSADALDINIGLEYERNLERYQFLRWGQTAFERLRVVPPGTGIVHQVNLEHLARVVFTDQRDGRLRAYPDTLVGTDSHTPMVNGLGVVGWGVGGIEAEAAMLGQPISMLVPRVVGFELTGELPEGTTATDLLLTITERLRRHGVVGAFVEFHGPGVAAVPLANRASIGNMSPEYGSTIAVFPIDDETLRYLRFTGRDEDQVRLVEAYAKEQGLWNDAGRRVRYSADLTLDLGTVEPSLAGPRRPQDRVPLGRARASFRDSLAELGPAEPRAVPVTLPDGASFDLRDGAVTIAAITSCTNTSNPEVMVAAGLLARRAVERGLQRRPWVKTTLAPGSRVVMDYYDRAGLTPYLSELGFDLVGFGCTTCIGNSGPLIPEVGAAVRGHDLAVSSVLSGNRNFEGRINPDVRFNYLASPPLVVAYALAGTLDIDLRTEPLGTDPEGRPVLLADIWPSVEEVRAVIEDALEREMFVAGYASVFDGDERWRALPTPAGSVFDWDPDSTYIRRPTFFDGITPDPAPPTDVIGARVLAVLGDSVTTDHISPAGSIKPDSPAGEYLRAHGVPVNAFNSYGARRGNHEVMVRGTFANIRLRNLMVPGVEGGMTRDVVGDGEVVTIFEAAERARAAGVPMVVLAGTEYGSGSSRDWAAKGTAMLGVRAVIARSYERIHRSNLLGMGVLPLEFPDGEDAASLGLTGDEVIDIVGVAGLVDAIPATVEVVARRADGAEVRFAARVRIDTPGEAEYYRHGGILPYVLRALAA
jgi:aconitate hydratase